MLTSNVRRVLVLTVLFALIGCAKDGTPPDIQRWKPLLQLAVQTATARLVSERPQAVPIVLQVAGGLRLIARDGNVTRVLPELLTSTSRRPKRSSVVAMSCRRN